ncbi:peptidoglycan/xylan/chitin deacetylase (PgdA/CDA1 family) [Chitinophaga dinghuensis]|uniref:Peptidoglycan/xylan/chitin deacetylase (PgdA/CDA1 family) n=1 Tax=Chitinophaga dinghuensis TaxID=1539050 RepID=A0A327WAX1_9BACT|nr:polysaccharide deacetylase family protein [Chitinophaga dinghuensis]RAJ87685.1 peptidoglycan/xylan/chitin deacetylase (PgdA/CDA1 family) [Chitinophaga dinghuensis]
MLIAMMGIWALIRFTLGYHISVWWLTVLLVVYIGLCVRGAIKVQANFFIPSLSKGDTTEKVVALSFDDGPLPEFTPVVLDILKKENVKAGFFCIGKNIPENDELLERIHAEGHVIGNHSWSHDFWFDMYSSRRMMIDLDTMEDQVLNVLDLKPRMFRPPYGVTNPNLATAVARQNLKSIGWSIRSLDTVAKDEEKLLYHILSQLHPGAIILLHDTCKITADILPRLIAGIRERGYRLDRIDKLLKISAYA